MRGPDRRAGRLPRQPGRPAAPPPSDSTRVMPTRGPARPTGGSGSSGGSGGGRPTGGGGSDSGGPPRGAPVRRKRKHPVRRVVLIILLILVLWIAALIWAGLSAWGAVRKVDAFPGGDRPAEGKGTNIVLVGSDSRAGLTAKEGRKLGTGGPKIAGQRTDSIMVLHLSDSGTSTLVSIPRDSWVPIPGHGQNKINASFSIGGPKLLVSTIEGATGLHIDHYMEIGFGGFAGVVNAVGGVRMCLPEPVKDSYAHIDLKAGCQTLNGKNALGYVRSRHAFAEGDFAREQHQREFLGALMKKAASPANLLVPWRLKKLGESGAQGLAVDKDMSPITAAKVMWTLKKITTNGQSVQVPIANPNYMVNGQSAVQWDHDKATALFTALKNDTSVNVKP